jgi:serine/threonine protein kinase
MAIGPGARIGPYEVTSPLGEGGMGKVWRAHHIALKRDDALKVLPDTFASDPERLARFQREAQILASLNHPNIAHVYA